MSVNYESKIVRGWEIPFKLVDKMNEITDYKYEDYFHRCNAYGINEFIYFGEEIDSIPCGWASSLGKVIYNVIKNDEFDWDEIRQEMAVDIDCYNAVATEPNIYIMCCVL